MEIHTITPEDIQSVATTTARSIPADQIDATFKSQYTGIRIAHLIPRLEGFLLTLKTRPHFRSSRLQGPLLQRRMVCSSREPHHTHSTNSQTRRLHTRRSLVRWLGNAPPQHRPSRLGCPSPRHSQWKDSWRRNRHSLFQRQPRARNRRRRRLCHRPGRRRGSQETRLLGLGKDTSQARMRPQSTTRLAPRHHY
jgi:hypothetical protein